MSVLIFRRKLLDESRVMKFLVSRPYKFIANCNTEKTSSGGWGNQAPEAGEPLERHPGDTPEPEDPQEIPGEPSGAAGSPQY